MKTKLSFCERFSPIIFSKKQKNVSMQSMSKEDLKKIEDENSKIFFALHNEVSDEDRISAKVKWDLALYYSFRI